MVLATTHIALRDVPDLRFEQCNAVGQRGLRHVAALRGAAERQPERVAPAVVGEEGCTGHHGHSLLCGSDGELRAFKPGIVYPYHSRDSDLDAFAAAVGTDQSVEVRLRNWYPENSKK